MKHGVSGFRNTTNQHHTVSLRNSPEPGSTDFEGNYLGPASGISFINAVEILKTIKNSLYLAFWMASASRGASAKGGRSCGTSDSEIT